MKLAIIVTICLILTGCEKTIHEASAPPDHINADTRSTAAVNGLT
jgi:hypothetical protein